MSNAVSLFWFVIFGAGSQLLLPLSLSNFSKCLFQLLLFSAEALVFTAVTRSRRSYFRIPLCCIGVAVYLYGLLFAYHIINSVSYAVLMALLIITAVHRSRLFNAKLPTLVYSCIVAESIVVVIMALCALFTHETEKVAFDFSLAMAALCYGAAVTEHINQADRPKGIDQFPKSLRYLGQETTRDILECRHSWAKGEISKKQYRDKLGTLFGQTPKKRGGD